MHRSAIALSSLTAAGGGVAAPWLAVLIRLWLAKAFAVAGIVEMMQGTPYVADGGPAMLPAAAGSRKGSVHSPLNRGLSP